MKRLPARFLSAALALALACGCAPAAREDRDLLLWFPVDPELNVVSAALDACPYRGEDRTIPALMSALLAGPPEEEPGLASFIPAGTRLLSWSLEEGVANVELSADFTAERSAFDGACSVTIRVYYLCKFGITMAVGGLRLLLRHRKRVKREQRAAALIPGKEG